jgi:hypothetical protein
MLLHDFAPFRQRGGRLPLRRLAAVCSRTPNLSQKYLNLKGIADLPTEAAWRQKVSPREGRKKVV